MFQVIVCCMLWVSVVCCLVIRGIEHGTEDISYAIEMRWYVEDCIKGFCCTLMRSIWSSPSVRQMRIFLDDYITSRTFLEPRPSGIAIHAWLFASNMRQCFLILKSWCPHFNSDALPPRIWCAWCFRNVSYRGSCLSTLARLVDSVKITVAFRLCLGLWGLDPQSWALADFWWRSSSSQQSGPHRPYSRGCFGTNLPLHSVRVVSSSSFCMERQVECPDLTMNNLIWCWQNWIHHWRCGLVNSFNQIAPTAKWLDSGLVWPY